MLEWIQILVALIGPIISAIVAWKVSSMFGCRLYERHEKERILRQILISKTDIERSEYVKCLSYIELTFAKDKYVLDAWRLLLRAYREKGGDSLYLEEKRDNLIREIAKVLNYSNESVSQLIGREPYVPIWLSNKQRIENDIVTQQLNELERRQKES